MFRSSKEAACPWSSICNISESSCGCGCGGPELLEPAADSDEFCQLVHWYGALVAVLVPPLNCVYVGPGDLGLGWLYWYPSAACGCRRVQAAAAGVGLVVLPLLSLAKTLAFVLVALAWGEPTKKLIYFNWLNVIKVFKVKNTDCKKHVFKILVKI